MSAAGDTESRSESGYEKRDLAPRTIALFAAGGAVVILLAAALALWMVQSATRRHSALQSPRPQAQAREGLAEPRLQVQGFNELREMRRAEESLLTSYGWLDREKGLVRIPVERAMELLAEKEGGRQQAIETGNRQRATGNRKEKEGLR
jgi:hypothetical protein